MALRANRPVVNNAQVTNPTVPPTQQAPVQQAPVQQAPVQQAPIDTVALTPQQPGQIVNPVGNLNQVVQDLNVGILENIDDLGGGNYVTIDGTEFLFKASGDTRPYIDMVIGFGKRFYQYYDEESQTYHDADTKLDDRYKLKFEIRWPEATDDGDVQEMIMSLSTTSAIQFINYIKMLAKKGVGINQVITRVTISREESRPQNGKVMRYSRANFEAIAPVQ